MGGNGNGPGISTAPNAVHQEGHGSEVGVGHPHHGIRHNHGEWVFIDLYAYNSKIRPWSPDFKVFFAVLTIILCLVLNNPYVSVAVIMAMAWLTMAKGKLPLHEYLSVLAIPTSFILLSALAIIIDFAKQPLGPYKLYLGFGYVFTSPAMLYNGFFLILKVFAAVSALMMLVLSTPSAEIIHVLRKMHVPKLIVELMHMIYRHIFILIDVFINMKNAAESRLGYIDIKTSWQTFGSIAGNMLVVSLNKANAYYDAMEARCYEGELLFLEEDVKVDKTQMATAAAFVIALIMLWGLTK
ncbi:MAG: cobalt ECF transporter T component CbiQ [Syntrophomonadaceae bacterium]|nr:cobalt ECF transporter T component CbiQ [Syntrophomonadaceae bacterium]